MLATHPVDVRLPSDLPLLHLDAAMIERVLVNLLENACKYTPSHTPIRISASVSGDKVRVTVEDDGPGLPTGREEAVFEKFERGHKEDAIPGVGLGLAICQEIVHALGGNITLANRQADGRVLGLIDSRVWGTWLIWLAASTRC